MFLKLGTGQHAKRKGKVVVLCHDKAFQPHDITGGTNDQNEAMTTLINMAAHMTHVEVEILLFKKFITLKLN